VTRRSAAGAAAVLLFALVLASQSWAELPRRVRFLSAFAPKELAVRRLGGSGAAFDRRYFSFLENARRSLPPGTPGVVVSDVPVDDAHRFLADYSFAPLEVVNEADRSHVGLPRGWIVARYGSHPQSDERIRARFPEGILWGPVP
jgi:hypothetical protein